MRRRIWGSLLLAIMVFLVMAPVQAAVERARLVPVGPAPAAEGPYDDDLARWHSAPGPPQVEASAGPGLWDRFRKSAGEVWGWVVDDVGAGWEWAKGKVAQGWEWTTGAANQALNWTVDTYMKGWNWARGVEARFANWVVETWNSMPDWARGLIKGIGAGLLVIGGVALAIVLLPASLAAAVVAVAGGTGALVVAGIATVVGGALYGLEVGGDAFDWRRGVTAAAVSGLLSLVGIRYVGSGGPARGLKVLVRGWRDTGGFKGYLGRGLESALETVGIEGALDYFIRGRLKHPTEYAKSAAFGFVVGGFPGIVGRGFVNTRPAKWLRTVYDLRIPGIPFRPIRALTETTVALYKRGLSLCQYLPRTFGRRLRNKIYDWLKPLKKPKKAAAYWFDKFISRVVDEGQNYLWQRWNEHRPRKRGSREGGADA